MPSGTSLAVLWLRLRTPRTGGAGGTLVRELSGHTQPERNNALRAGVDGSPPRVIRQLGSVGAAWCAVRRLGWKGREKGIKYTVKPFTYLVFKLSSKVS